MYLRTQNGIVEYTPAEKAINPAIAAAAHNSAGGVRPIPSSPFAQTGGGVMEQPLPRTPAEFNSLFGPGYPLIPDPLDPLGPNGRTAPRRSEYLVSWNLQLVDRQVPWTMLRWLAEDCDLVNRCIQLTQDEQCGLDWGWTFSPQLLNQIMVETGETNTAKATALARDKYGEQLLAVQRFFDVPDRDMNQTFVDWLQALLWDHLVYDGIAVYPRYSLDGSLRNLELIDASTIKLYRDNRGRVPQPPAPAYAQILYGFPRGEFQHTLGEADDEYQLDQLAYFIRRPRNTSVYGFPQVEEVMALATTYLARQAWMRAEYTHGTTPRVFIETAETESWTPEQMAWFEQIFNDRLMGQIERRHLAFLLRPGMKPTQMAQVDEKYKSDYDNWLISQIASRFGRPATMLGVQARAGLSGGRQMEGEMNQSDIYSGKALTNWLIRVLNALAVQFLNVPAGILTATSTGGTTEDIEKETAADVQLVNAGVITRNELRAKRQIPLIDEEEADQLAITTGEGVTFLTGLLEQQKQALAAGEPVGHAAAAPAGTSATDGGHEATVPATAAQKGTVSPESVNYRPATDPDECCGTCSMFQPETGTCTLVAGVISPAMVCDEWDPITRKGVQAAHEGATERLMTYWAEGEGAAKIGWGTDGDFDRCRLHLGKYVNPGEVDGLCANLHHRATGAWPGHAPGESKSKKGADGSPKA